MDDIRINAKGKSVDELLRKSDQHSELGSLAAMDGDKEDAARQFRASETYRRLARELHYG